MDLAVFSSALNASQLEAVTYCDGPSLIVAGAGSGKTRVLTYKIAYLLQNGYEPWSILALTFTNKAAREMNERISSICKHENVRGLWSGTFHSLFARLLRIEHEYIDYPADYTIYDTSDSRSLIKTIVKELELDEKLYKATAIAGRISEAKNHLILPEQYATDSSISRRDAADGLHKLPQIYSIYQQRLHAAGAMDFDDLLLNTYLLLHGNEDIRNKYKTRFRYILVDEYQDTNLAQHRILCLLTDANSRICVVGDDAQSIYGFRGADITNILNFQKQYPSALLIKLECNYRSTHCIVEAANSIIKNNINQIPKKVYSSGDEGDKILLYEAQTDKEEAQKTGKQILKLKRKGVTYNEIALLYRTNAQSRVFEQELQSLNIPYKIYGGLSFYQRKEIKDVLAYLRLIVNTDDEEAFKRIVNYPARGIGKSTIDKLQATAYNSGVSMWQVAERPELFSLTLGTAAKNKLAAFCSSINTFRECLANTTASAITKDVILKSGIAADISAERTAESISRMENIDELLGSIQAYEKDAYDEDGRKFVSLNEFLSTISLLSETEQADNNNTPKVTLMTVHAAKGLEYDAVFITGMEEDLFPNANARIFAKEMEEERRLFYVAVTRAKRYCFLSFARSRYRYGTLQFCEPSQFLDEIDERYLQKENATQNKFGNKFSNIPPFHQANSQCKFGENKRTTSATYFSNDFSPNATDTRNYGHDDSYKPQTDKSDYHFKTDYTPKRVTPPTPPAGFKRAGITRKSAHSSVAQSFPIGTRINHERFGLGTIIGTEGSGDSAKVRVQFDEAGVKNLLVKFARFTILKQ